MTTTASLIRQDSSMSQPNLRNLSGSWQRSNTLSLNSSKSFDQSIVEDDGRQSSSKLAKPDIVFELQEDEEEEENKKAVGATTNDVIVREKKIQGDSGLVPPRQTLFRNTTADFFLNEQNRDWPGLSLDLYDEILDEIMFNVRDSGLRVKATTPGMTVAMMGDITDKDTQTDFSDEDPDHDRTYWNHVPEMQHDLISYLSITSLNKSFMDNRLAADSSSSSETETVPDDDLLNVPTTN